MDRDREYILDALEAAKLAIEYVGEKTIDDFLSDQAAFPNIPWSDIIRMRNVMIHEYDGVDLVVVWETIHRDLPVLVGSLENMLEVL